MSPAVAQLSSVSAVPGWAWTLSVLVAALLSLGLAIRFEGPRGRWGHALRRRFVLGVPWGTLLTVAGVGAFYLLVQAGATHPNDPLAIPFISWSYFYPLGIVTSPFAHANLNHVTSNLLATLLFGPIAEYAWGHFPRQRGSQSFGSLREHPLVRVLAVPAAAVAVGLLTGVFAFGPTIGFSGVVFAVAGFALVSYPVATIVALVARSVVGVVMQAVQNPVTVSGPREVFTSPGWANVAIQGHLFGVLLGVGLGGYLAARRDRLPGPARLWLAFLVFAVVQGLWQLYAPLGGERFVLFRAAGVVFVFLLAALVVASVAYRRPDPLVDALGLPAIDRELPVDLRTHELAAIVLGALVVSLALLAVWSGFFVLDEGVDGEVSVDGYEVTYAEGITDEYASSFAVGPFGDGGTINTSGVVVTSERRHIFYTVVGKRELASRGRATVVLGSPGTREEVVANRTGWNPVGNDSVYAVFLRHEGDRRLAFASDPSTARPRIDGRHVTFRSGRDGFGLTVTADGDQLGRTPLPSVGANRTAGGLRFNRTAGGDLYAHRNDTRVRIAGKR
ncbi:rhomboid family intramembrane serine protease [Halorientalis halophila]|uniref:rhomboid family intramembrane serine protease n=1 Tax=Halorientalis halophila TaxID=3108499 RepID=UPI003008FF77